MTLDGCIKMYEIWADDDRIETSIREEHKQMVKWLKHYKDLLDSCEDCISRQQAIDKMQELEDEDIKAYGCEIPEGFDGKRAIRALKTLQPVKPKIGHCKDCKQWKDSDGVFRRGIDAESKCPLNRIEVFEGNGYCYMFEPRESDDKGCFDFDKVKEFLKKDDFNDLIVDHTCKEE